MRQAGHSRLPHLGQHSFSFHSSVIAMAHFSVIAVGERLRGFRWFVGSVPDRNFVEMTEKETQDDLLFLFGMKYGLSGQQLVDEPSDAFDSKGI